MAKYIKGMALHAEFAETLDHLRQFQALVRNEVFKQIQQNQADDEDGLSDDELDELRDQIDRIDDACSEAIGALENDAGDAVSVVSDYF